MPFLKSDRRWTCASWTIILVGLACFFLLVRVQIWLEELKQPEVPEPTEWVIVERALLDEKRSDLYPFVVSPIVLDPYDSTLLSLTHRAHRENSGYQGTLWVPPRLISKFSLHAKSGENRLRTSAIWLVALLPDLALRTPENHHIFEDKQAYRLEVTISSVQPLFHAPDWVSRRYYLPCEKTSFPHVASDYPGLIVNATRMDMGYLNLKACAPGDALPDGKPLLIVCSRDIYTRELTTCRVRFVVPWQNYSEKFQRRATSSPETSGRFLEGMGNAMTFEFPAAYLPQWRRVRDLSVCLIEVAVQEIEQIGLPSRNPELCEVIRSALHEGQPVLAPGSAGER